MSNLRMCGCLAAGAVIAMFTATAISHGSGQTTGPGADGLDPKVLAYKLSNQIQWKWTPHHMSRPHWHPNARYIDGGELGLGRVAAHFVSAGVAVARPSPTISRTASISFAPS